ncbi:cytochrome P450 [Hypoxylon rubiginosum]|uniref:Cytochrome P450 n=1 Tax=Hypoxylon rubiginosum TaxID=110542 RepID=A0ACB9YXM7_9PEZI|nr:cytochrome P450 [Hypoxylon rubiginosum]
MTEIRGHRKNGLGENSKDPHEFDRQILNIIGAHREEHTRVRRVLSHAFSAQAMLNQEPIIKMYVDQLFEQLHKECRNGTRPLNMVEWFNFTTFDVIGDLAFGEPFGCLENSTYHPWVALVFAGMKNLSWAQNLARYPLIAPLLQFLMPKGLSTKWAEHQQLSEAKVRKRLALPTERPDFMDAMLQKRGANQRDLTFEELVSNASVLIIAGSETTATLLAAATYFLTTNPYTLTKLTQEVRSTFASEDEITLVGVQKLSYMLAVLDESMRMYPPVPGASPRKITAGGDTILGRYVPEGTTVDIWQAALYRNPAYFAQADEFVPERWLGDPRFANDSRQAFQPFSTGPRNCIGRNLAYSEMRLILARLVWNFDLRLAQHSQGWDKRSKMYILWEKGPLEVYLTPRSGL